MFRGMFALALALGLMAGTTFAKEDVREEPAPAPRAEAPAAHVHEHAHACPDWHCAQGGGAHFNLAKPKDCGSKCESSCTKGCGDGCSRTCGQWHKCGETHAKGDHHHQYPFWHGWFSNDCHHHCNERGACAKSNCDGWFQCGHRHLTPSEQTTRLP